MIERKSPPFRKADTKRGPGGDARPDADEQDTRTGGSFPQEDVEGRELSIVNPEDYPEADRAISKPD